MGCAVFANGMSIACKVASGKTVAAMPDVCLSPPTPPAGPVPIPYPNTAVASDTDNGSKTVQIGGDEVMLKDQSTFKKSTGDEAATKSLGMGVVSHQIQGEVNFCAWSMDVKFEGQNVPRHLDLTLHNEMCIPANTPTWPYIDSMAVDVATTCQGDIAKEYDACQNFAPHTQGGPSPCPPDGKPDKTTVNAYADRVAADKCLAARRCQLVPYEPTSKQAHCCPGQTGHHLAEAASFFDRGRGGKRSRALMEAKEYSAAKAPCVCAEGTNQYQGTHGLLHTFQSTAAMGKEDMGPLRVNDGTTVETRRTTYGEARDQGVTAAKKTFPESGCDEDCLKAQLDAYHNQLGVSDETPCRQVVTGYYGEEPLADAEEAVLDRSARIAEELVGEPMDGPI